VIWLQFKNALDVKKMEKKQNHNAIEESKILVKKFAILNIKKIFKTANQRQERLVHQELQDIQEEDVKEEKLKIACTNANLLLLKNQKMNAIVSQKQESLVEMEKLTKIKIAEEE
jgi:hypothetical protein